MGNGNLVSVKFQDYPSFSNPKNKENLVQRVGDGSIIVRFDRTKLPEAPTDVVCPHFLELKWANGCPFVCAWCYLKGTLRFLPTKAAPRYKDRDKIEKHLLSLFNSTSYNGYPKREVLNTGELSDSLMQESNGDSFSEFVTDLFNTQEMHRVLFLTKSVNIRNLMRIRSTRSPIVSFTLNAEEVSRRWEHSTPPAMARVNAAKQLSDIGYEVRLRIDPMVPIKNWRTHYIEFIDKIFDKLVPERITIGSLRGLQSTINNCKDRTWTEYLSDRSNWGKKIDFATRFDMYSAITSHLKESHNYDQVALCKETIEMWDKLGMDYRNMQCNCIR